jgi:hypothetical protein
MENSAFNGFIADGGNPKAAPTYEAGLPDGLFSNKKSKFG